MAADIESCFDMSEFADISELMFGDDYDSNSDIPGLCGILSRESSSNSRECLYQCFERHKWCIKHW